MKESFSPNFEPKEDKRQENQKEDANKVPTGLRKALLAAGIIGMGMSGLKAQQNPDAAFASSTKKVKTENAMHGDARALEVETRNPANTLEIKIANYFETDKADIAPDDASKIADSLGGYLLKLNVNNIDEFLAGDIVLHVSCDPRRTNFKGEDGTVGNFALARARANTAIGIIQNGVSKFAFTNLTADQVAKVIEKFNSIQVDIPVYSESDNIEDGVADYHTIVNPKTGKPYTDAEWADLQKPGNEADYADALSRCRRADLSLVIQDNRPEKPGKPFNLDGYDQLYVLFDNSPSMETSKDYLAVNLKDNKNKKISVDVSGFASKIDTTFKAANLDDAVTALKNMPLRNDATELAVDVALTKLGTIKKGEGRSLLTICTDEELQKVNKEKLLELEEMAAERNVTVEFCILYKKWNNDTHREEQTIYNLSLSEVNAAYDKVFEKRIRADVEGLQKYIKSQKAEMAKKYDELSRADSKRTGNDIKREIGEIGKHISGANESIANLQTINIDKFK